MRVMACRDTCVNHCVRISMCYFDFVLAGRSSSDEDDF